ncbi:hypothetical protein JY651_10360 [Pyxidicoccus parkwayensis]|uniref:Uncharacterized protein n=1 Tax=Pyxidicoccus parkwayensis TaxID=2813578 RepID=A0ABX7P4C4_9BACT|nr:hypothetical protein [Pyxidicoccus parkwaysis]QSQ25296.1 hypothetical protein JY651_10360 [Pyxidicoccus parkwaysis]
MATPQGLSFRSETLDARTTRYQLMQDGSPVSWRRLTRLLIESFEVCDLFTRTLAESPLESFFWETVPVSATTHERPFEMVLVDAPALRKVAADPTAFAAQLSPGRGLVHGFSNLGGDARLIVPGEMGPRQTYAHLARFVREASEMQTRSLWRAMGGEVESAWLRAPAPVWVSTSGLAVPWLHLRIDSRPKYYSHAPYRSEPA